MRSLVVHEGRRRGGHKVSRDIDLLQLGHDSEEAGDFTAAREFFEKGGRSGVPACWSRLGYMFDVGIGVPIDKAKAMSCYRRAWRGQDWVAATNIAILYREVGNNRAMFRWFERAAACGDGDALVDLAKCYIEGTGVRKNIAAAQRLLGAAKTSHFITEDGREQAEAMLDDFGEQEPEVR